MFLSEFMVLCLNVSTGILDGMQQKDQELDMPKRQCWVDRYLGLVVYQDSLAH